MAQSPEHLAVDPGGRAPDRPSSRPCSRPVACSEPSSSRRRRRAASESATWLLRRSWLAGPRSRSRTRGSTRPSNARRGRATTCSPSSPTTFGIPSPPSASPPRPSSVSSRRAARPRGAKSIEIIVRSVDRANRLIQDLLDTTRIEAGALSVARDTARRASGPRRRGGGRAAAGLVSVARAAARRGARSCPPIWADRARLLQVFENLVGNAIKFTPQGGRITIGAAPRPGEVLFWVADTGTGIPAEDLPHVFDRFWKAKRTERRGRGARTPHLQGHRRGPRGSHLGREPPGPRDDLLLHHSERLAHRRPTR